MSEFVTTPWRQVQADAFAAMSGAERTEYDSASAEEELKLQLAERVYNHSTDR